jgi:hypothetical protein
MSAMFRVGFPAGLARVTMLGALVVPAATAPKVTVGGVVVDVSATPFTVGAVQAAPVRVTG